MVINNVDYTTSTVLDLSPKGDQGTNIVGFFNPTPRNIVSHEVLL